MNISRCHVGVLREEAYGATEGLEETASNVDRDPEAPQGPASIRKWAAKESPPKYATNTDGVRELDGGPSQTQDAVERFRTSKLDDG